MRTSKLLAELREQMTNLYEAQPGSPEHRHAAAAAIDLWHDLDEALVAGRSFPGDWLYRNEKWSAVYDCVHCNQRYTEEELDPVADILDRVRPGQTMPYGQCPGCENLVRVLTWARVDDIDIQVAAIRDPDGGTDIRVYVNGAEPDEYPVLDVDAGRGWSRREWKEHAEWIRSEACPAALRFLDDALTDPPGGEVIEDGA